jgi:hypothetical protein
MSGAAGDSRHVANDVNALVQLVQRLAGDENFQNISGQYEEVPRLKGLLDAKEQLLERRNGEIDALKAEYDAIYHMYLCICEKAAENGAFGGCFLTSFPSLPPPSSHKGPPRPLTSKWTSLDLLWVTARGICGKKILG